MVERFFLMILSGAMLFIYFMLLGALACAWRKYFPRKFEIIFVILLIIMYFTVGYFCTWVIGTTKQHDLPAIIRVPFAIWVVLVPLIIFTFGYYALKDLLGFGGDPFLADVCGNDEEE